MVLRLVLILELLSNLMSREVFTSGKCLYRYDCRMR